jgi:hypothetical protein
MGKSPTEEASERIWAAEEKFRERQKLMREHGVVELVPRHSENGGLKNVHGSSGSRRRSSTDQNLWGEVLGRASLLPSYPLSYLRAAELLVASAGDELTDVALPLLYLHRHALQLALKSAIDLCADIAEFRRRLEKADGAILTNKLDHAPKQHRLPTLVGTLRKHAASLSIAAQLDEIESFVGDWESIIEKSDPTRLRYQNDVSGQPSYSRKKRATVGVRETHETVMRLMAKLLPVISGDQENLGVRLLIEWVKLEAKCNQLP